MKSIDFTKPGGLPLTQDQLAYLQSAYTEVMPNIIGYRNAGANVAVRLAGIIDTIVGPTNTISAGWFLYNGVLVRFTGGSYSSLLVGHAIYVQITNNTSSLTFNDGSTPNVILDVTATLVSLANTTPDGSTVFQLAHMQEFCKEGAWSTQTFTGYGTGIACTGTIKYKKSYLENILMMVGSLTTSATINIPGTGGKTDDVNNGTLMFTLPAGYIPNSAASFTVNFFGGFSVVDSSGTITQVANNFDGSIDTAGNVYIKFLNIAGSGATFTFNVIISLD